MSDGIIKITTKHRPFKFFIYKSIFDGKRVVDVCKTFSFDGHTDENKFIYSSVIKYLKDYRREIFD